jgi:hypothetical protein
LILPVLVVSDLGVLPSSVVATLGAGSLLTDEELIDVLHVHANPQRADALDSR